MVPLSILDLAPVSEGSDAGAALRNALQPGAGRRAPRLPPLLDGRASFDAGHRQRRDRGRACAMSPAARRRIRIGAGGIMLPNHSPAPGRRTVRHARSACSPAGSTSASAARPAPTRPRRMRCAATSPPTSASSRATCSNSRPISRPADAGRRVRAVPGEGLHVPVVDPRLEPLRRRARRRAWPALRLRLALRAAADDGRDRALPRPLQALGAARRALRHARLQRLRRRQRRGRRIARHLADAGVRRAALGHPGQAQAAASPAMPTRSRSNFARCCGRCSAVRRSARPPRSRRRPKPSSRAPAPTN